MKLIKPAEISGKIFTLIDESEKELHFISAYNNFRTWEKFKNRVNNALKRGVRVCFYVRDKETHEGLESFAVPVYRIPKLHAKIYLNEEKAILTSMNLIEASDNFAIDFAIETETKEEYIAVKETYLTFIKRNEPQKANTNKNEPALIIPEYENSIVRAFFGYLLKKYPSIPFVLNETSTMISAPKFPFPWTDFQFDNVIKINFQKNSLADWRKQCEIHRDDFSNHFGQHRGYWENPPTSICIYGNFLKNGLKENGMDGVVKYKFEVLQLIIGFLDQRQNQFFRKKAG